MTSQPSPPAMRPDVRGISLDSASRCAHWHGPTDIIAIKMFCCNTHYACYECHTALAGHPAQPWPQSEFETNAILCGACGSELSIRAYLDSGSLCPSCNAAFNPRCSLHHPLYFDVAATPE